MYHVAFDLDFKRNTHPGKFVVIEGIDGSGKTTQAHIVAKKLPGAVYTKEPTSGPIGKFIREGISGEGSLPPVALQHLLSADRAVHEEEVKELLNEGKLVISDRYLWSSVAYGMADREGTDYTDGEVLLVAQSILSMYHRFMLPNMTFYLDVSVDSAMRRIEEMGKVREIYEHRDKLELIKKGYDWLIAQFPKEIIVIDGERERDEITADILENIKRLSI
jgi:dTMP kinase